MTLLTEFKPKPLWWRHFRPITLDDHGMANMAFFASHVPQTFVAYIKHITPYHSNSNENYTYLLPYWIEPPTSHHPTWRSLVPETIDCFRTRKTDRTWKDPIRTEPAPTHQPIRMGFQQPIRTGYSERIKYYWSVTNTYDWSISTNQKITLIIFWLTKNGKDKICTSYWSKN